jgi:penicillin-binding protein 1A
MTTLPEGPLRAAFVDGLSGELDLLGGRLREAILRLYEILADAGARGHVVALAWTRRWRRPLLLALPALALPPLVLAALLVHHLYFDRSGLPNLDAFIRFEPPTIGEVHDARGKVLIEVAREYRRVVSFDQVPVVLRQAILASEDKSFFSHGGIDYLSLPRVAQKAAAHTLIAWWKHGPRARARFPQGGSTLTQQLVRNYFLQDQMQQEKSATLGPDGLLGRLGAAALGIPATNKLARKLEEVRLTLWLEAELARRYGSQEQAKREIFSRYASFIYLGHSRYGFAAASEYYLGKPLASYTAEDAGKAALLAAIPKSPLDYDPITHAPRALQRRNAILALMARNGYIGADLAKRSQAEPILLAARSLRETHAPATIENVFGELKARGGDRFSIDDLVHGRIQVNATVDERVQTIVNEALESGLLAYEKRHPRAKGLIQGSVVVLDNGDAAVLAEAGGRQVYNDRTTRYGDFNRATDSLRQAGSALKPFLYLAAFGQGLRLDSTVPDEPIGVEAGDGSIKWIANYDAQFKGPIPLRQALAESRNAVAVWITREIGLDKMIRTAKALGLQTPLQPYITTALGASEVRLLELAGAYRAIASGLLAEPYIVARVTNTSGAILYEAPRVIRELATAGIDPAELMGIQEGLRGVVRLPSGTAHALAGLPIPVMGKTGTTSDFRDALFVGSTYGAKGITIAVRIGFDDNRALGSRETGGLTALPIFREILTRVYADKLVGPVPRFPRQIEEGIDAYLAAAPAAPLPSLQADGAAPSLVPVHDADHAADSAPLR